MALESGRSPVMAAARALRFLAAFGLIHGAHEWLEALLLQAQLWQIPTPGGFPQIRLGMLFVSFLCLLAFAVSLLRYVAIQTWRKRQWAYGMLLLYLGGILLGAWMDRPQRLFLSLDFWDGMIRYLLAVPAAVLSLLALDGLAVQVQHQKRVALAQKMQLAAMGFGVYAFTQIFVHPLAMFPANVLNEQTFLMTVGVPIQLVRTIAACVIAIGLLKASQVIDAERKEQLLAAQQAQLQALQERETLRRELLRHIVQAQEDERARIARELHDETAQVLSAFSLELASLRTLTRRNGMARQTIERLYELSRQMSQSVYRLIYDLRPAHLDDLGLEAALKSYFEQDCAPNGLQVVFTVSGARHRLDPLIETALFRVTQEALSNVLRHSGVNQAEVRLCYETVEVRLQVSDHGRGFDPVETFRPPRGWGLAGMRERIEAVGGTLQLISAPGQGTTVDVLIPLRETGLSQEASRNGSDHHSVGG